MFGHSRNTIRTLGICAVLAALIWEVSAYEIQVRPENKSVIITSVTLRGNNNDEEVEFTGNLGDLFVIETTEVLSDLPYSEYNIEIAWTPNNSNYDDVIIIPVNIHQCTDATKCWNRNIEVPSVPKGGLDPKDARKNCNYDGDGFNYRMQNYLFCSVAYRYFENIDRHESWPDVDYMLWGWYKNASELYRQHRPDQIPFLRWDIAAQQKIERRLDQSDFASRLQISGDDLRNEWNEMETDYIRRLTFAEKLYESGNVVFATWMVDQIRDWRSEYERNSANPQFNARDLDILASLIGKLDL